MRKLKVGMIQMRVLFHEPEANFECAKRLVKEAVEQQAELCIIPECSDLGWGTPKAYELAEPIPGKWSDAYCTLAIEYGVFLVVGLTEKWKDRVYNSAILISKEGEVLLKHRKINVLTGVEDVYSIGDRLGVVETPLGTIGITICADNSSNSVVLGHTLARMGAQIILSPCAWAVRPERDVVTEPYGREWFVPYQNLASTYHMPIVGVSNVGEVTEGTWKGWKAIGHSIAVDAEGEVVAVLPYGERAETVKVIEVEIMEAKYQGTSLAERVPWDVLE